MFLKMVNLYGAVGELHDELAAAPAPVLQLRKKANIKFSEYYMILYSPCHNSLSESKVVL